jgi:hypothetical protein
VAHKIADSEAELKVSFMVETSSWSVFFACGISALIFGQGRYAGNALRFAAFMDSERASENLQIYSADLRGRIF